MGIFGQSNTYAINEIHRNIGDINHHLQKIDNSISQYNDICLENANEISESFLKILEIQQAVQPLLNSLSDKEQAKMTLCWMDGRYLPLHMWNASYQLFLTQIKNGILKLEHLL